MTLRLAALSLALVSCAGTGFSQVAVVNGASFRTDQPVTGGSWVSAFGSFPGVVQANASSLPLPTTLSGVTVTVGGIAAPINFVSSTQINFLIPFAAAPGQRAVEVRFGGTTLTGNVRIMTAAPGLFTAETPQQGPPLGAILNAEQNNTPNTQQNPARRGQAISIYATGPGALSVNVDDGAAAPADPLARTRSTPQVYIGGVEATLDFSGMAPGFAGLWQINAYVPERSFISGRVPVQVFIDGVDSNEVSIFVNP